MAGESWYNGENAGKGGAHMSGYISVGLLLAVLGAFFLFMPYEKLHQVFRGMRSPITTKVGGAVLLIGGAAMIVRGLTLL